MSQLTSHILNTTLGKPAAGVAALLFKEVAENSWEEVAAGTTNHDGRITNWLPEAYLLPPGNYKIKFETGDYFRQLQQPSFYPFVEVVFTILDNTHYHVPLLLNPYGYSTYRGS
jgi:5-hydroxyisourate hydrolase